MNAMPHREQPDGGGGRAVAVAIGIVGAALLGFGILLSRLAPSSPTDLGEGVTLLPVPLEIPQFALVDHRGEPFDRSRLAGRWSLLFFGYTYCPDICPATLQRLAEVQDRLPNETQVVFVSVDPERDSQERIAEYVGYFHSALIGVTGSPTEIDKLARAVGAFHRKAPGDAAGEGYLVDHSVSLFLVDPGARLEALMRDPSNPQRFLRLLAKIESMNRGTP